VLRWELRSISTVMGCSKLSINDSLSSAFIKRFRFMSGWGECIDFVQQSIYYEGTFPKEKYQPHFWV
jgi:hypothetical protein